MDTNDTGFAYRFAHALDHIPRWVFFCLIGVIAAIGLYLLFLPQPSLIDDNFHYLNLAKNIYNGEGYTDPYSLEPTPETVVVPGYPFMLSLVMRLVGNSESLIPLKIFNNLCYWLFILIIAYIFLRYFDINRWVVLIFSGFLAFNAQMSMYASSLTTEAPFMLFSSLAVLFMIAYSDKDRTIHFILATIFTTIAIYMRLPGVPLAATGFIWLIWKKKYSKAIIFALVVGGAISVWLGPIMLTGQWGRAGQFAKSGLDTSRAGRFSNYLTRYFHHIISYLLKFIPTLLLPGHAGLFYKGSEIGIFSWSGIIVGSISGFFLVWGIVKKFSHKYMGFATFYVILYFGINSFFGSHGKRYATYLFPFLVLLMIIGIIDFTKRIKLKPVISRIIFFILLLIMIMQAALGFYIDYPSAKLSRQYYRENGESWDEMAAIKHFVRERDLHKMHEALRWCKENVPEGDVIAATQYRTARYLTDHHTVTPVYVTKYFKADYAGFTADKSIAEIDTLAEWYLEEKATWIVLDPIYNITSYFIKPMVSRYQSCFEEVYRTEPPVTRVMKIDTTRLRMSIRTNIEELEFILETVYRLHETGNNDQLDSLIKLHKGSEEEIERICYHMSYLMDVGKLEKAEMIFKGADILYPNNKTLWFNRGIDLNEAKINNKSIIYLERALALGADSANCYNNMATAESNMGDMASAEKYFFEAARFNDQDPVIMRNYITVVLYQGRYQDAVDLIDLQLARDDIDSNYIAEIASFRKQYLKWRETQPNKDELPK